jgi:hypothetical protein
MTTTQAITIVSKQCGKFRGHPGSCDDTIEFTSPHAEDQCVVGIPVLKHNDRVLIDGMANGYAVRAVVTTLGGYGASNRSYEGPDGMARYLKALERNEKHGGAWISVEATVISAYREAERPRTIVKIGGLVRIVSDVPGEGGIYRLEFYSQWDHHNVLLVRA